MPDVEVAVYRGGRVLTRICRPLRELPDGTPAVTYKRKLHPVVDGAIHLDDYCANSDPYTQPDFSTQSESGPPQFAAESATGTWDFLQQDVVEAEASARLLVDAGPGTGKTAVACGRVSFLIHQGVQPTRVWLISFTRTAVREIRARIVATLGDVEQAHAVKIATLDAQAWALHSGFKEGAQLTGSYELNIEALLDLLRTDGPLTDYLEEVEHLIVDEAQDIVGIRADLVDELIRRLPDNCGVTVFADEAQAIYGFAEHQGERARQVPLIERLRRPVRGFTQKALARVYRTTSTNLLKLFTETRESVLDQGVTDKLSVVRRDVEALADGRVPRIEEQGLEQLDDAFVLFRRRAEVLMASSFLMKERVPHRIRMSGLPTCIWSWVGACLSELAGSRLTRTTFHRLWAARVAGGSHADCTVEDAWILLVEYAGRSETEIDLRKLRSVLGRSQPPADFCRAELGTTGAILGTIHAAKGREASTVHLMLPIQQEANENEDLDDEARVMFVGATRARARLLVGKGFSRHPARALEHSGRAYVIHRNKSVRAQMEIGHHGDVTAESVAGTSMVQTAAEALNIQGNLLALAGMPVGVTAWRGAAPDYRYRMVTDQDEVPLGGLSEGVNCDLFGIADHIRNGCGGGKRRPPDHLKHLFVIGVRTIVLGSDSPEAARLHHPWNESGILLAPIVLGYTTAWFPLRGGHRA